MGVHEVAVSFEDVPDGRSAFIVVCEYDGKLTGKEAHAHEGQEFDYMLEGHMKIVLGGNDLYLGPGDSVYFDSSLPHAMYAIDGDARFIAVVIK